MNKHVIQYILLFFLFVPSVKGASSSPFEDIPYFFGADFLVNQRLGNYFFDISKEKQVLKKPILLLYGGCLGKRYSVKPWLRFQVQGLFHFGSLDVDTLQKTETYGYKHAACDADIHILLPEIDPALLYFFVGGGIHYMHTQMESSNREESGLDIKRFHPSAQGGVGMDLRIGSGFGLSISYTFRYCEPVAFEDQRDMPISAIEYRELFLSHMAQIKLLFDVSID